MFVDHLRVIARAGNGGNGSVHFRRELYVAYGGPDGGDGGAGGDVILEVDPHTDSLRAFFYDPKLIAEHGKPGARARRTGANGKTKIFKVPPGTLVYSCKRDEMPEEAGEMIEEGVMLYDFSKTPEPENAQKPSVEVGELLADLTEYGQRYVLCKGGKGGKGNWHFRGPTNQVPMEFTPGTEGESGEFYLELRRIADAGMVGFPNAGKSTLVSKLSAAKPKIANYPFTTLKPMVGVVEFPGFQRATVADIPGLIEGAHENVGLGHEFLRHIMRCKLLIMVLDMGGNDGRDPISDYEILRKELSLYDEALGKYPFIVVANKMDLESAEENLRTFRRRFPKVEVIPMMAEIEHGLDHLKERLEQLLIK